jgi:hypothetical protein
MRKGDDTSTSYTEVGCYMKYNVFAFDITVFFSNMPLSQKSTRAQPLLGYSSCSIDLLMKDLTHIYNILRTFTAYPLICA